MEIKDCFKILTDAAFSIKPMVCDPPYLLKSLRNNLLTHYFAYNRKTFSFSDIRQLFQKDNRNKITRAAPQVIQSHIWTISLKKLSVSLAAQVFGHTTAAALKTVAET